MKVTPEVIDHVANLARLNLTEQEKAILARDMQNIITYVDKLNELDTSGIKPMEHVASLQNVLRQDEVKHSYEREIILSNAPDSDNGCFRVPKVVE